MPNDETGKQYKYLIKRACLRAPTRTALTRGLQLIASHLGGGMSTESTIAVAYFRRTMYVAKLATVNPHNASIDSLEALIGAPLDGTAEMILSVFNDGGATPIERIVGVGGGKAGLHAEMMIVKYLVNNGHINVSAWDENNINDLYIAASQGACPACAGFMNLKNIPHTGVRSSGKCSPKWFNPVDDTCCGSEVCTARKFGNIEVEGNYRWTAG